MRLHRALAVAEIRERCAPMVAVGGEGVGERAIDRLPRGEVLACRSCPTTLFARRRSQTHTSPPFASADLYVGERSVQF